MRGVKERRLGVESCEESGRQHEARPSSKSESERQDEARETHPCRCSPSGTPPVNAHGEGRSARVEAKISRRARVRRTLTASETVGCAWHVRATSSADAPYSSATAASWLQQQKERAREVSRREGVVGEVQAEQEEGGESERQPRPSRSGSRRERGTHIMSPAADAIMWAPRICG